MSANLPKVEESTKFNLFTSIWIVPFIALMIAGWLAYQYFSQLGPEIRIVFPKNEGLQAGQSHIKYKDVPIGVVKRIELQEDGNGVTVIARMDKDMEAYLNDDTRFWIVKPEVGFTGVSGLETLISGTYINMYTQKGGKFKTKFHGMSHAYRKINDGEYFHLNAPVGYNIRKGTPLYFKNIKVGQVEYMNISLDGSSIDFIVFVEKFYVPYVHADSKFWVASALDVDISNGRLDVNIAPFSYMLHGGISFSSTGEDANDTVEDTYVFHLYQNKGVAEGKQIGQGGNYIRTFELDTYASIAKLKVDSSVRYEGYDVGRVKDIKLSFEPKTHKMMGKVYLNIDTSSFATEDENSTTCVKRIFTAIKEGLHAKIVPTNLLTGMLYVQLLFEDVNTTQKIVYGKKYPIIPDASYSNSNIMDSVTQILDKLNNLPLDELVTSVKKVVDASEQPVKHADDLIVELTKTVNDINKMTSKKSFEVMPDELNKTLREMTKTLKSTEKVVKGYDSNSLIREQLTQTLQILTKTSQEMQAFLRMLNRKPNSLIFGDN